MTMYKKQGILNNTTNNNNIIICLSRVLKTITMASIIIGMACTKRCFVNGFVLTPGSLHRVRASTSKIVPSKTTPSSSSSSSSSSSHRYQQSFQMVLADTISTSQFFSATNNEDDDEEKETVFEPLIVCGPSGVGKGTIINKFMEEMGGKEKFGFTVSHTTRQPRQGEVNGIHYHFVDIEQMKHWIEEGDYFLEYAQVHGNYYGTSWSSLRDVQNNGGKRCLLDIDVQGVQNIKQMEKSDDNNKKKRNLKPKYIFIAPPSMESLKERLIGRGSESEETLARRTANAQREVEYGLEPGNFDAIVVNGDLDLACKDFARKIQFLFDDTTTTTTTTK